MYHPLKRNPVLYTSVCFVILITLFSLIHKLTFFIEWNDYVLSLKEIKPSLTAVFLNNMGFITNISSNGNLLLEQLVLNPEYSLLTSNYTSKFNLDVLMSQFGFFLGVLPCAWIYYNERSKNLTSLKLIRQNARQYFSKQLLMVCLLPVTLLLLGGVFDYIITYLFLYEGQGNLPIMIPKLIESGIDINSVLDMSSPFNSSTLFENLQAPNTYHQFYWVTLLAYGTYLSSISLFVYACSRVFKYEHIFYVIGFPMLFHYLIINTVTLQLLRQLFIIEPDHQKIVALVFEIIIYVVVSISFLVLKRQEHRYV